MARGKFASLVFERGAHLDGCEGLAGPRSARRDRGRLRFPDRREARNHLIESGKATLSGGQIDPSQSRGDPHPADLDLALGLGFGDRRASTRDRGAPPVTVRNLLLYAYARRGEIFLRWTARVRPRHREARDAQAKLGIGQRAGGPR